MLQMSMIGTLGKDAEVKQHNGRYIINFSLAHNYKYKDGNGIEVNATTWVNCSYWLNQDKISPYLNKGTQVYVCGMPNAYGYQNDRREIVATLQLRINELKLINVKYKDGQRPQDGAANVTATTQVAEMADDLPF